MKLTISENLREQKCDVLVINMFEGETTSQELANKYALEEDGFKGKFKNTYLLQTYDKIPARKILVIGMGKKDEMTLDRAREIGAKITNKVKSIHAKSVAIDFDEMEDYIGAVAEGLLIGDYKFDKYKSDKKEEKEIEVFLNIEEADLQYAEIAISAMNMARDLANEPAALVTPTKLAEIAQSLGLQTTVYSDYELEDMNMGAFTAVAKGSSEEPKFIHIKYQPKEAKKKIAIIGKGITFDAGGLDLKPASSMLTMRDDMSGAACVLAVMSKIKELNADIEVHGIIAACENMPGCSAYKPGDILTARNGKTIEVDNTDAEGRLTLADALCFACELGVDEVIDIATLTGACMVALGTQAAGIMGNDEELIDNLIDAAEDAGERYWPLPMYDEYKDSLKSEIADMKNTGSRWGGASTAGLFLENFVKPEQKWAHIDIAGVAFLDSAQKYFIKGATGAGVRALLTYLLYESFKLRQEL